MRLSETNLNNGSKSLKMNIYSLESNIIMNIYSLYEV